MDIWHTRSCSLAWTFGVCSCLACDSCCRERSRADEGTQKPWLAEQSKCWTSPARTAVKLSAVCFKEARPLGDARPLGEAICWQCGKVLWSKPHSTHTCLVHPPHGLSGDDAPASVYLRAVPDCNLTFIKPGRENAFESDRWYCCSYCHTHQIHLEFHVGDVFSSDPTDLKPVVEWDMQKPESVASLRNTYETGQVSLAGLFSMAVRDAGFTQWKYICTRGSQCYSQA